MAMSLSWLVCSEKFFLLILCLVVTLSSSAFLSYIAAQDLDFSYENFENITNLISFGDVQIHPEFLQLNTAQVAAIGRVLYSERVQFQDPSSKKFASFNTFFTFSVNSSISSSSDGLAFIIVGSNTNPLEGLSGQDTGGFGGEAIGLLDASDDGSPSNHVFAVETDTYKNTDLQDPSWSHVGVDVNSLLSIRTFDFCPTCIPSYFANQGKFGAWIVYTAGNETLQVAVHLYNETVNVSIPPSFQIVISNFTLSDVLVDDGYMYVGFSSATGAYLESHYVHSWNFSTSGLSTQLSTPSGGTPAPTAMLRNAKKKRTLVWVLSGIFGAMLFVAAGVLAAIFFFLKKKPSRGPQEVHVSNEAKYKEFLDGPRIFSYKELSIATRGFHQDEMLGCGGFGSVYKGTLRDGALVAVKKIAENSDQGEREFFAEVSIISRTRHHHLVKLRGWCCERGQLMLVYDYMPNRSLDKFLFHDESEMILNAVELTWDLRKNILIGVASALTYLHEEWEQCVVHRDVKPSNVMLDEHFSPRLGDFGLARVIARTKNAKTTMMAGTRGYMAPELIITGKASTKTDVFSYGALILAVICGRSPLNPQVSNIEEPLLLLDDVWRCYENGELLNVVDVRLVNNFDKEQVSTILLLGLVCSHPDPDARPTMGYVCQVLKGNSSLPPLPLQKPTASYSHIMNEYWDQIITSGNSENDVSKLL
jgi:serine/threonine protein kinase